MEWSFSEGSNENTQRQREERSLLVINPSSRGQVKGFQEMGKSSRGDQKGHWTASCGD